MSITIKAGKLIEFIDNHPSWNLQIANDLKSRIKELIDEYSLKFGEAGRKEEAGRELPDNDKIFENARNHFIGGVATDRNFDCYVSGQKDMRRQASELLASKESQLLQLGMDGQVMQGEHEQIVESLNSKLEAKDKEIRENIASWERCLNVLNKTSDDLVECRKELEKSNAEVERLKEGAKDAASMFRIMEIDKTIMGKYPEIVRIKEKILKEPPATNN